MEGTKSKLKEFMSQVLDYGVRALMALCAAVVIFIIILAIYRLAVCLWDCTMGKSSFLGTGIPGMGSIGGNLHSKWYTGTGHAGEGGSVSRSMTPQALSSYLPNTIRRRRIGRRKDGLDPSGVQDASWMSMNEDNSVANQDWYNNPECADYNCSNILRRWDGDAISEVQVLQEVAGLFHNQGDECGLMAAANAGDDPRNENLREVLSSAP